MVWARVANVGVWTDGATREGIYFRGGDDRVYISRTNANNALRFLYRAGGVTLFRDVLIPFLDWRPLAFSWSASAGVNGEVRAFVSGVQQGATLTGIGVWADALSPTRTLLGAQAIPPFAIWHGWLGHCAVWSRALSPTEVAEVSRL